MSGSINNVAKIVLDLHEIFNRGMAIDAELNRVINEAVQKNIPLVEIIPGKGSGQLKKRVLRFLARPDIKNSIIGWKRTIRILGGYSCISSVPDRRGTFRQRLDLLLHAAAVKQASVILCRPRIKKESPD